MESKAQMNIEERRGAWWLKRVEPESVVTVIYNNKISLCAALA